MDLNALYGVHLRALYAFVYSCVGTREAAEDITGEVFLAALVNFDASPGEPSIVAMLYRVARHAVSEYWRAGRSERVIALDGLQPGVGAAPEADWQHTEQTAACAGALFHALPQTYRVVLKYRLLEGLSVVEAAHRMGTSVANIKVLQHQALKRAAALRKDATGPGATS